MSEWDEDTRSGRFALNSALGKLSRKRDQCGWDMALLLWMASRSGVPIDEKWRPLIPDHWPPLP
jgi:hypothetical protein